MKRVLILATALATVCLTGCKKEEAPVDVRDAAVGNYKGTMTMYVLQNNTLKTLDEISEPTTANGSVSKDSSNATAVRIEIDGEVFYGSKLVAVSNGFVFDVEEQTVDLDNTCHISGFNAIEVGTSKYNGVFFSETKKLEFGFKVAVSELFDGEADALALMAANNITDMVILVSLTKR